LSPVGKVALISTPNKQQAQSLQQALANKPLKLLFQPILADSSSSSASEGQSAAGSSGPSQIPAGSLLIIRKLTDITEPALRRRKCRLIIRNLSFQATEQNILDKMSKFGPVVEVLIPKLEVQPDASNSKEGRRGQKRSRSKHEREGEGDDDEEHRELAAKLKPRGYAFVTFLCENDAKHVVSQNSGGSLKICNREVAVDFCTSKDFYEKGYAHEFAAAAGGANSGNEDGHAETSAEAAGASELAKLQAHEEEDDDEETDGEGNDDDEAEEEVNDANEVEPETKPTKVPKDNDSEEGRTVFLRDLGFDVETEDIREVLEPFGRILFVAVVRDEHTHACKGSAFIKFANPQHAMACVEAVDAEQALLQSQRKLLIKDRTFRADMALSKQEAKQLQQQQQQNDGSKLSKPRIDKRNLYLANEGLNTQESPHASSSSKGSAPVLLTNEEREKRIRAQTEKRKKLINPLYFVSANR
jgi:nucleolar protein 4